MLEAQTAEGHRDTPSSAPASLRIFAFSRTERTRLRRSVGLIRDAVIAGTDIAVRHQSRFDLCRFLSVSFGLEVVPSVSAIVGDITPADGVPKEEKSRREQAALDEMCQVLGGGMRAATLTHAEADNLERMDEWFNRLSNAKRKTTRLHYYFQDMLLGKSPMAVRIAEAAMTKKSLTLFGCCFSLSPMKNFFNSTVLQTELGESEQVLAPAAILVMVLPLCRAAADEVATRFDKLNR
ncbi:hypothetical protein NL676_015423 [Syzygium grande]|nr:hypothetical protein NL676_015423 [Syzygium grande]